MDERRQYPRLRLRRKVRLVLSSGKVIHLFTHDLSREGIQITSPSPADIGDEFTLLLTVPEAQGDGFLDLQVRARVMHCIYDGSAEVFRIGMRFIGFSEGHEERYIKYLEQQLRAHYLLR